jgi:hypothetical protein
MCATLSVVALCCLFSQNVTKVAGIRVFAWEESHLNATLSVVAQRVLKAPVMKIVFRHVVDTEVLPVIGGVGVPRLWKKRSLPCAMKFAVTFAFVLVVERNALKPVVAGPSPN